MNIQSRKGRRTRLQNISKGISGYLWGRHLHLGFPAVKLLHSLLVFTEHFLKTAKPTTSTELVQLAAVLGFRTRELTNTILSGMPEQDYCWAHSETLEHFIECTIICFGTFKTKSSLRSHWLSAFYQWQPLGKERSRCGQKNQHSFTTIQRLIF